MHVGGAAHVHVVRLTCGMSGPRACHRAHVRMNGPRCRPSVQRAHQWAKMSHNERFPASRANLLAGMPPEGRYWANFVSGRLGWNRAGRVFSRHQSGTPRCQAAFSSDRTGKRLAGTATAHHKRMGMKKALPKECLVEMQNPHRWIAPRGAAARPEGLEPPTF